MFQSATSIIITVGTELTDGRVIDTNSAWLAGKLKRTGFRVAYNLTAPDSSTEIGRVLRFAVKQKPDLIVVAGGLGPTQDDLTAAAIARELDLRPELIREAAEMVVRAVGAASIEDLRPHQRKQATLPAGSRPLEPVGTAPGFHLEADGACIIVLPGVPLELRQMWEEAKTDPQLMPLFRKATPVGRMSLCLYGVGEPEVSAAIDELGGDVMAGILPGEEEGFGISVCSRHGEITLDLTCPGDAGPQAEQIMGILKDKLGDFVFSDGEPIEEVIGRELTARGKTLATGESCTGGLLGAIITDVSGSSAYFRGTVVAYHNDVKKALLKIRQEILDNVGAVSEPVAQQLALGVRAALGADYGIGITGVAGPTGGTPEKPVGLVYICVSSEEGDVVKGFNFPGGRDDVRRAATVAALHLLHRKLLEDALPPEDF